MMAFDHENMGCPANSLCERDTGMKLLKWRKLIEAFKKNKKLKPLQTFVQKNGLPIEHYTKLTQNSWKQLNSTKPVLWGSQCEHHRNKGISLGKSFFKIATKKSQTELLHLDPIHMQVGNKVKTYFFPKGIRPNYLDNESAYFIHEEEGVYLTAKINQNGRISIVPRNKKAMKEIADSMAREAKCTKIIQNAALESEKLFYEAHYCRMTWNIAKKTYQLVMAPLGCY